MAFANAGGPFSHATEPKIAIEPSENIKENFEGATGNNGRNDKEKVISIMPTKNIPADCANFIGDIAKAPIPPMLSVSPVPALFNTSAEDPANCFDFW
eukprot:CAMPEP_0169155340 /NCGR_PEP_ID=MMETSP1015-20121227/53286_1 /TAXON_ID=342587 /ORGANISM="Karlodinium micrum, Strain CCMP2283" /LENGTH=97 /DNA_ID=CAMNT_0009225777 /DNA_START=227 /DNA_END=520 /DNA_ORIENTATION=-